MLYFHIPFCKQRCSYCNFHFSTSLALKDDLLEALHCEIDIREKELLDTTVKTIYFGGGTPSLLKVDEIRALIDHCEKKYNLTSDVEITLEANPDDLNSKFLKDLSRTEINRLSIGTQSFFEKDLQLMNRAHTASEAEDSIKRAQDLGFENITIDLIYGSSEMEIWKQNLRKAVELLVPHISSYALTVEPKTALLKWSEEGKISAPDEALQNDEFHYMSQFLRDKGFVHYEISNFGKEGFFSKHNSSYWQGKPYLGYGPSAHSYDGERKRSWNVANNSLYIKGLMENKRNFEEEILSEKEQLNERIMIGLRTIWGADYSQIQKEFSSEILEEFKPMMQQKINEGSLLLENGFLKIPEKHWFMADGIASDLFLI